MPDDSPTEQISDDILDRARESREPWINWAAATAAVLAAFAAISSAASNSYVTTSGRDQIKANDLWGQYQAKSIKAGVLRAKIELLEAQGKPESDTDRNKLDEYEHDLDRLRRDAELREANSEANLARHEVLERGVTLFHLAIAIVAIAVLSRLRFFWLLSVAAGLVGIVFFAQGIWMSGR